jgi:GNAT superfamily N-acetyltransferase
MSTVPFTIRSATPADAVVVARLNAGLFAEDSARHDPAMDQGWPAREGARYFAELLGGDRAAGWLALDADTPIGYAAGRLAGPADVRPVVRADLESIFVVADRRGDGVGAALVAEFARWARSRGADELSVTAYAANERAVAFYARHGFAPRSVVLARPIRSQES